MGAPSNRPVLTAIFALVAFSAFFYYSNSTPDDYKMAAAAPVGDTVSLSHLAVTLEQTSTSPPAITIKVKNTHPDKPLTLLNWNSPLDPMALKLGLISITPAGESTPLQLPTIQVRRKTPPEPSALVTIEPGKSKEQEIALTEPIVPLEKIKGGKAKVECKGMWTSVWPVKSEQVSEKSLELMGADDGSLTGEFGAEAVEVSF